LYLSIGAHLCHVEPQADGFALLEKRVELSAVKQIVEVKPQSFQNILRKLHLLSVPARQSVSAPVQQHLQWKTVKTDMTDGRRLYVAFFSIPEMTRMFFS